MRRANGLELLVRRLDDPEPAQRLGAVGDLRARLDEIEAELVAEALSEGWSWTRIGAALGVSKQAAHAKHRRVSKPEREPEAASGHRRLSVSTAVRRALRIARDEAAARGHHAVGTEHLLLGVLAVEDALVTPVLRAHGLTLDTVRAALEPTVEIPLQGDRPAPPRRPPISRLARRELETAVSKAVEQGDRQLELDRLLISVLGSADSGAARTLDRLGISATELCEELDPQANRRRPA